MRQQEISEEIVVRLNRGDMKAFDAIYHAYYLYLCAVVTYYVHDRNVAAELVNDVCVGVWRNKERVACPVLPYLKRAAQNAAVSYLRSSHFNERLLTDHVEEIYAYLEKRIIATDNPLHALEDSEMDALIRAEVEKLPPRCRAVFQACLYEGKSYAEIADEQQLSVSTVRGQMRIALNKLREALGTPCMITVLMMLHECWQ